MDLFGFEEDLEIHNSEIASNTILPKMVPQVVSSNDDTSKLTISQIQDLLSENLANDTVSDADTFQESETSIFDETTSLVSIQTNLTSVSLDVIIICIIVHFKCTPKKFHHP